MRRRTLVLALLVVCVLVVVAGVFAAAHAVAGPESLTNRTWTLTHLTVAGQEQTLVPVHSATIRFRAQDREVMGSGGCNSYGGSYLIVGNTLHITNLAMTLMACIEANTLQTDSGIMGQESSYMQAIGEVDSYHLDGNILTLQGNGGRTTLTFRPSAV